jgi:hypothetical protein
MADDAGRHISPGKRFNGRSRQAQQRRRTHRSTGITVGVDTSMFSATISPALAEARLERRAGGEVAALSERDSPGCARLRR